MYSGVGGFDWWHCDGLFVLGLGVCEHSIEENLEVIINTTRKINDVPLTLANKRHQSMPLMRLKKNCMKERDTLVTACDKSKQLSVSFPRKAKYRSIKQTLLCLH